MEAPKTSSDEIDLQELVLRIVLTIKRNLVLIISFFVVGTLLGYAYSMVGTKIYASRMMITSDLLTESYMDKLARNLDAQLHDNRALFAEKTGMKLEDVLQVRAIEMEGILKEKPIESTVYKERADKRMYFVFIEVEVYNPAILPALQEGIVAYFENNEFIRLRQESKRKYFTDLVKTTEAEIAALNEFKTNLYAGNFKGTITVDPSRLSEELVILTEMKLKYESDLLVVNSIQVVEGFAIFDSPNKPNRVLSLAAGSSLGLLLVGILIVFKSLRSLVRMAEKTNKS